MSNNANTIYQETAYEKFESLVEDKNWGGVNQLFLDLQEDDMSDLELRLIETLNDERLAEWKKWREENDDPTN